MKKQIFTFWEPRQNMPDYLKLCIETWKKFLPDYKIIILDYSNLDKWLGKDFFDRTLYTDYSLPKQADAIRCALLNKHGGIWLDVDTILTSDKFRKFLNSDSDFVLIGRHIGMIIANKNSIILSKWLYEIKINLLLHKICKNRFIKNFIRLFSCEYISRLERWDFLGNAILNKYLLNASRKNYCPITKKGKNITPENNFYKNLSKIDRYRKFYFADCHTKIAAKAKAGIICLHNSWTPDEYKTLSCEEFLNTNCTLANIFKEINSAE